MATLFRVLANLGCFRTRKVLRPNAVDVGEARAHARARTARSNATSRIGGCAELGGQDHHLRWRIVGHVQQTVLLRDAQWPARAPWSEAVLVRHGRLYARLHVVPCSRPVAIGSDHTPPPIHVRDLISVGLSRLGLKTWLLPLVLIDLKNPFQVVQGPLALWEVPRDGDLGLPFIPPVGAATATTAAPSIAGSKAYTEARIVSEPALRNIFFKVPNPVALVLPEAVGENDQGLCCDVVFQPPNTLELFWTFRGHLHGLLVNLRV